MYSNTWQGQIIFYGPYDCCACGKKVIKTAELQGGVVYEYPDTIVYPNTEWQLHNCQGDVTVAKEGLKDPVIGHNTAYTKPPSPAVGEGQSLESELWREYELVSDNGENRVYRIINPVRLWVGTTTHRVLDAAGVVHCVPNVGYHGCVLRWHVKEGARAVDF